MIVDSQRETTTRFFIEVVALEDFISWQKFRAPVAEVW